MKRILLLLVAIAISSCSCRKDAAGKAPKGSIEGNWELTSIAERPDFGTLYPNAKPTINFNINETKITGKNSCNNYGGSFSLDGIFLKIDDKTLYSTKMFCDGDGEKTFMGALGKVSAYSVSEDGSTLSLWKGKTELMRFKKV